MIDWKTKPIRDPLLGDCTQCSEEVISVFPTSNRSCLAFACIRLAELLNSYFDEEVQQHGGSKIPPRLGRSHS
ncbi:hypothetical protein CEXT_241501 [Caerostris extrusa]|uniref:Uncharacterized protein n=1 Tax=Caerostris extrusa TaxID=172846 RepID=A0AAV4TIX4_CAEEX|nr:hypothetical protein CEXT_241501 [Caerostris extrusa]